MALHRMQSMIDPDKQENLLNYDLDSFKNSIWENFLGSQVQITKLYEKDGTFKITNKKVDKMGPVQLNINNENLYAAWEESRKSDVDGYKGLCEG